MAGPGEFVPDITEGITRIEELPKPRIERRSRNYSDRRCRLCGHRAGRYAVTSRTLHDLADPDSGRPVDLLVTYSKHCCWLIAHPSAKVSSRNASASSSSKSANESASR